MDPAFTSTETSILERYRYNDQYQMKILALLVRYPNFIHMYGEVVHPGYFEYESMTFVCQRIVEFFVRYAVPPSYDSLVAYVSDWCTRYHVPSNLVQNHMALVATIYSCDMSDGDAVRDSAIEFAKRQALKSAVIQIAKALDQYDGYEKSADLVQRALMVGQGVGSFGTEVFGTIPRLPGLLAANSPYAIARKIATPFTSLNAARQGGLGQGECILLIGSSGQGKSIIKSNFARVAIGQCPGQWIAHATLELQELDNHLRYGAMMLNIDQADIVQGTPEFQERCLRLPTDQNIYVKWFPPGITGVGAIRSWISMVSARLGVTPCMIIVDYPDLLSPSKASGGNLYIDFGNVFSELIVLINDYKSVGVFSSQMDRHHQYSNEARSSNVANSIQKLYHTDVVGTINQSETDKQNGVARIWWDKSRRGRDMFWTYFRINYARALVYEDAEAASQIQPDRQTRQAQRSQQPLN